ncbi:hypothetical protein ABT099_18000 [Streptomyces prasinus]|uniref:hypothetical protein n=1 Tax=Streptomyces prasinus TaxID=67345 RepID=UPI00332CA60C
MLKLTIWRAAITGPQAKKFWNAVEAVPSEYTRALTPAREAMANALGLSDAGEGTVPERAGRNNSIVRAEMFHRQDETYVLAQRSRRKGPAWNHFEDNEEEIPVSQSAKNEPGHIYLYVLSGERGVPDISEFETAVKDAMGVELLRWNYEANRFMELKKEGRQEALELTEEKVAASRLLCEKEARTLATAIKSSLGGLILSDVERQLKHDKITDLEGALDKLQYSGLIAAEYVVVCAKNNNQVARFGDMRVIEEMSKKGVRCGCGRKLEDERREEAVTVTDFGRKLLDKSTWMSVVLVDELRAVGVSDDRIMIEYSSGGDEMDCIADINGELVLFELKDKEFSLREAYSFGAKISLVRPRHPVIVTTERVGGDAKEHFQKAQIAGASRGIFSNSDEAKPIRFIEGIDSLRAGIEGLASSVHRADTFRILRDVMPLAAISSNQLLDKFTTDSA